jgi:hypothetical protein
VDVALDDSATSIDEFGGDLKVSWEAALTLNERGRLFRFSRDKPDSAWDLGQTEKKMCAAPLSGNLFTLIHGMGLVWVPPLHRWLLVRELACSMGYPVTEEWAHALGTTCVFTRGLNDMIVSRRAGACQVGNAMHVNAIGACLAILLMLHPCVLGGAETARFNDCCDGDDDDCRTSAPAALALESDQSAFAFLCGLDTVRRVKRRISNASSANGN